MLFKLSDAYVATYDGVKPPFGFNGLGELVYQRTYSRILEDNSKEGWQQTVRRVVEGCYTIQKEHVLREGLGWDEERAQKSAEVMFRKIFNMKFLPPGRGLWAMGTDIIHKKKLTPALYNCSFVSTSSLPTELAKPFCYLMDMSMLGVGVGFDTLGAGLVNIHQPTSASRTYQIPDTREGWVESVRLLLESYFVENRYTVEFDYSLIRAAGQPLKTFGGVSPGPAPLAKLHTQVRGVLDARLGKPIDARAIVDIMNMIGVAVVAGNVRRSAEIALGSINDQEYIDLKNYEKNPERAEWGWTSNNSVTVQVGDDYSAAAKATARNGEPGYVWLDNCRAYGRLTDGKDNADEKVVGINPCGEIPLESYELCNVVETFPHRHEDGAEYLETLKYAYLYAKTVALLNTHWVDTNRVMLRNRRIGISMSGVVQFLDAHNLEALRNWCEQGYAEIQYWDAIYSAWLCVPASKKTTTVKPSGTVSLLAGATPGVHYAISPHYIRRMRLSAGSELVPRLKAAGYTVVPAVEDPVGTVVVEFPISIETKRATGEVSMWEKLALAAFMQRHWADNAVSVTVDFDPAAEGGQIKGALNYFQYHLKSVSFLPRETHGYQQAPYEAISKEQYDQMLARIQELGNAVSEEAKVEKYCDGDACSIL